MAIKFTCPKCGKNELGSVEQIIMTYPITRISDDGDLEYDTDRVIAGDGEVLAYQCINCGFELKDEQGVSIHDCLQLPKWIKRNKSEKKEK